MAVDEDVEKQFAEAVNMGATELKRWLGTVSRTGNCTAPKLYGVAPVGAGRIPHGLGSGWAR